MLVEEGTLLDLHPIPPSMHAFAEGRDLGVVDERKFFSAVRATERELERVVTEGLFLKEAELQFDVIERFDTLADLLETAEEWGDIRLSKRLRARLRRVEPPIDLHEHLVLRRYRASASSASRSSGAVVIPDGHSSRGRSRYSSIPLPSGSRR
jgi:hypothetical protein